LPNTSGLVGTRLGPYEILSALGAGGMGEVYKARDTRLDRLVAIKVLSPALAGSADARERFEREARAISRLSHPHICALFDVGHASDTSYLVMELLDGETLSALVARGPTPLPHVLRIGREIGEALASAHRHGIVHRDLKPGNVLLTSTGVKLLDFGLAKSLEPADRSPDRSEPPTAPLLTAPGTWLGTAPYMSPEQIGGGLIEGRSDIFALGAVLYEMATGKRAFEGQTSSAITAAILHREPPSVSSTTPHVPPSFDRLVRTCLEKDPDRRWQSAHDVALQLAAIAETPVPAAQSTSRRSMQWLGWAAAILAVAGWLLAVRRPSDSPVMRTDLEIALPPDNKFAADVESVRFAVSPDGHRLAFVAYDSAGVLRVWLRELSSVDSTAIAGTEGASSVFWSPDSRALALFVGDTLKRLDLATGAAVTLCAVQRGIGLTGTWSPEGQILFASVEGQAIFRVSTAGGTPVVEVKPDPKREEVRVAFPSFLPDGRRYLYTIKRRDATTAILLGEHGKEPKTVGPIESNAQFVAPATLVFAQGGTLVGQPFDPDSGRLSGEPLAIGKSVRSFGGSSFADFSASPSGTVVYQSHAGRSRVAWVDRGGREISSLGSKGEYRTVRISPRGRSALVSRILPSTGAYDIWSIDFERGSETRLTLDDRITEVAGVLSSDEQVMFYGVGRGSPPNLTRLEFGTGRSELIVPANQHLQEVLDLSPDGRLLAFSERTDGGYANLWTLPLQGTTGPTHLRQSTSDEDGLRFSPDGRFFSFMSNESGRSEVYVAALAGGAKTVISSSGGSAARWSADGHALYYVSADNRLLAVPVRTTSALEIGTPTTLFSIASRKWIDFDVSRDGSRFLALIPEAVSNELPLTAVQHWSRPAR
jgi:eukaryotic-like serine/threonine-protein kinase